MKKFTDIGQFNQVIRDVRTTTDYKGKDENGDAIFVHDTEFPTLRFRGTVKLHGTNSAIVSYKDGSYKFQSRERELSLGSDNAGFMTALSGKNYKKLFEGIEFNDSVIIYGEWVGCFPYKTPILLANGEKMAIGTIVKQKLDVEVMSYNQTTGKLEAKKIIGWYNNGETDDWLKINIQRRKRGGKSTGLVVTPNHKIFLKEDNKLIEKFASELKIGDKVLIAGNVLTYNIKQFLMGTLLGDGSFSTKRSISVSHSNDKQKFYNDFIETNFNNILNPTRVGVSGHGSNMKIFNTLVFPEIEDLYNEMYQNGKTKQVSIDYLNKLSPLALATWYMDDGSIINHNLESRQYRCALHCQGFGNKNVNLIKDWLDSRGFYCNISKHPQGNVELESEIHFNVEGSASFLYTIAPYVIDGFNYKLPEILQKIEKISWWNHYLNDYDQSLIEAKIESIEKYTPIKKQQKIKYDIEVEDNHNYFANNTLVHNSGVQGKVAIAELSKRFVIFAVRIDDVYQDMENFKHLKIEEEDIYNIMQFGCWYYDIDFNRPELSQNAIVEKTLEIEEECPVGNYFGVKGIGEGQVLEYISPCGTKRYVAKSKGLKHANGSKVKTMRVVDEDKINALLDLADEVTPVWRLDQMLVQACDLMNGGFIDRKYMGEYMKLIMADVLKEESDKIIETSYEFKDLGRYVSEIAKKYFFDQEINRGK